MRWFWTLRRDDGDGGHDALERAEKDLDDTIRKWGDVHEVTARLRDIRARNHFAEQIEYVMRGAREGKGR